LILIEFRAQPRYLDAFKLLRHRAEEVGVFVLLQGNLGSHHTNIGVETFRGFALSDDIAPFYNYQTTEMQKLHGLLRFYMRWFILR